MSPAIIPEQDMKESTIVGNLVVLKASDMLRVGSVFVRIVEDFSFRADEETRTTVPCEIVFCPDVTALPSFGISLKDYDNSDLKDPKKPKLIAPIAAMALRDGLINRIEQDKTRANEKVGRRLVPRLYPAQ